MSDVSGGNGYMNNHTLSQQDLDPRNDDVSCGNVFINSHTISQCNESISFDDMNGYVQNGYVSDRHGSMNIHAL